MYLTLLAAGLAPLVVSAQSTTNPTSTTVATSTTTEPAASNTPTMSGIAENCDQFYQVSSGDSCDAIVARYGISIEQFRSWNSGINGDCTNLWLDYYVCVHVPDATTTTTTTTSVATEPAPTEDPPISAPTPLIPGIVGNCQSFHLIEEGDNCYSISMDAGITFAQLRAWNTQIDAGCTNLWLGYYVCIGV